MNSNFDKSNLVQVPQTDFAIQTSGLYLQSLKDSL